MNDITKAAVAAALLKAADICQTMPQEYRFNEDGAGFKTTKTNTTYANTIRAQIPADHLEALRELMVKAIDRWREHGESKLESVNAVLAKHGVK